MLLFRSMGTLTSSGFATRTTRKKHFYQFYKGREDFLRFVIPFLRVGLENREACVWIVSRSIGILEAAESFQRQYDLFPFVENGQLVMVPAERWYLERGRFSQKKVLEKLQKFIDSKNRRGFAAFRGVSDLGWLDPCDWPRFQTYEARVNDWIQTTKLTALCAYPIRHCSISQTKDILDYHDSVFLSKL